MQAVWPLCMGNNSIELALPKGSQCIGLCPGSGRRSRFTDHQSTLAGGGTVTKLHEELMWPGANVAR